MQTFWPLFVSFILIAIGAYGGGLVAVPLIQHELVDHHHWLSLTEMSKIVAIAQMTPGPIAINAATFVGYRIAGIGGSVVATTAIALPSVTVLTVLSGILSRAKGNSHVWRIRQGLRAGVLSLLVFATWSYGRGVISGWPDLGIAVGAFLLLTLLERKVHPLTVIVASGLLGLLIF